MRRLSGASATELRSERGTTTIIVAIMMAGLIGMAAFVVDVGALFDERRDLQNGADAAAFAVALDCGIGHSRCNVNDARALAETLASENTNDGAATVLASDVDIDVATQTITITARTADVANDDGQVDGVLSPVIGVEDTGLSATASASWGPPAGAVAFPITISACEWGNATGGFSNPNFGPGNVVTLIFHSPSSGHPECASGPGHDVDQNGNVNEGGFGFLQSSSCSATVVFDATGVWMPGRNGSPHPGVLGCSSPSVMLDQTILVPIFDTIGPCSAGNDCYHIIGLGAFHVLEMNFGGQWRSNPRPKCKQGGGKGSTDCMIGYFTQLLPPDAYSAHAGPAIADFGVVSVALSD